MTNNKLGNKLKHARERLDLNITEAAKRLGYPSYQTLRNIECGEREVKVSELARFAEAYFCKISDFLTKEPEAYPEPKFLWREAPESTRKLELEAKLFQYAEHGAFLEKVLQENTCPQLFQLKATQADIQTDANICDLSNRISDILGLGKRPAFSLLKVLEQDFCIKVIYCDLSDDGSAASTLDEKLGAVIVINSIEVPWRRNFDLAHELFHLITWDFASPDHLQSDWQFEEIEKKANSFASNLLLPAAEVEREIHSKIKDRKLSYGDIVDISRDFGVSTQALVYRMRSLRMINWETAKKIANDPELSKKSMQIRGSEIEPPRSERLTSLAIRCLRKGLISRGKFAKIVNVKRPEIDEFIEGFGLTNQEGDSVEVMAS